MGKKIKGLPTFSLEGPMGDDIVSGRAVDLWRVIRTVEDKRDGRTSRQWLLSFWVDAGTGRLVGLTYLGRTPVYKDRDLSEGLGKFATGLFAGVIARYQARGVAPSTHGGVSEGTRDVEILDAWMVVTRGWGELEKTTLIAFLHTMAARRTDPVAKKVLQETLRPLTDVVASPTEEEITEKLLVMGLASVRPGEELLAFTRKEEALLWAALMLARVYPESGVAKRLREKYRADAAFRQEVLEALTLIS